MAALREALGEIGDSIIVVPGADRAPGADTAGADAEAWSLHVHTADPGAAVELGMVAGRVHQIRISAFTEGPFGVGIPDRLPSDRSVPARGTADRGVLAVVSGAGAAELFVAAGATVLRCDGEIGAMDLLAAIRKVPHREVMVLPNGALRAEELVAVGVAARDAEHDVLLLPSASMVQGLASLAVHDRGRIARRRRVRDVGGRGRDPLGIGADRARTLPHRGRARASRATGWGWSATRSSSSNPTSPPPRRCCSIGCSDSVASW